MKTPSGRWCWWRSGLEAAALSPLLAQQLFLLAPAAATAAAARVSSVCEEFAVDGDRFDLGALAGPHTAVTHEYAAPTHRNTTYTLDLCAPLRRKGDVPPAESCPAGTRVCAIRHRWDPKTGETETDQVIPIVVERTGDGEGDGEGDALSWKAVRLPARGDDDKGGDKDGEGGDAPKQGAKREGLRLTMQGTTYQQRTQWLVVDFRCDPDLEGTEGEWESVDEYLPPKAERGEDEKMKKVRRADKKKGGGGGADKSTPERQLKKDGAALIWEGYQRDSDPDGERDTLYLTWYTKYVCSAGADEPDPDSEPESRHWGFFTWFVILVFLAVAAYLILGSWINYNRHGARGWDLVPHGDMIRDLPYLMRDFVRRVFITLQNTGPRGILGRLGAPTRRGHWYHDYGGRAGGGGGGGYYNYGGRSMYSESSSSSLSSRL